MRKEIDEALDILEKQLFLISREKKSGKRKKKIKKGHFQKRRKYPYSKVPHFFEKVWFKNFINVFLVLYFIYNPILLSKLILC